MERAHHLCIFDVAIGKRELGVRAGIVGGKELIADVKNRDRIVARDLEAGSVRDLVGAANFRPGHGCS